MPSSSQHKATVTAPSNIAFIKYWGARNLKRAVPVNRSISMTLRTCVSRCTAAWLPDRGKHVIELRNARGVLAPAPPAFAERIRSHLNFLRRWAGVGGHFHIATENSFPAAAGIASSASGFAALTLAVVTALDRRLSLEELSSLARLSGSGSAARSVAGGFVEWPVGFSDDACHARVLAPAKHWPLANVIAVVSSGPKGTSSLDGHRRARTSPYFRTRQRRLPARLEAVREAIAGRDFEQLGTVIEAEAVDLHCIAMTSVPPIFYWQPATLVVLETVRALRAEGVPAYATMDAGPNVHVICLPRVEKLIAERLAALPQVETVIRDRIGDGPAIETRHLF
ncbi:MAG: diphosphomevalonate decarboxylase [Acidobacteria bacterium]|nr:MAG: diphosphomevalonate decarboxylase [Acidobacteriota bacterium]